MKLNEQRNLFKLFQNDVGLLASQYASGIQLKLLTGEMNINFGAVYENFVAQELMAHGFGGNDQNLYYFNSKRQGELDFIIEQQGEVIPIEVKSGKDYERHNALRNVMADSEYGLKRAYVLCNDNVKKDGSALYVPIYMTMFIHKNPSPKQHGYRFRMS